MPESWAMDCHSPLRARRASRSCSSKGNGDCIPPIKAKSCWSCKQPFASRDSDTANVEKKSINVVLAEALAYYMERGNWTQAALSNKSGVGQTTISLYLRPESRKPGAKGKLPSAKLTEVEMIAGVLGVEVWELLRPMSPSHRAAYAKIEQAFKDLEASPPAPTRSKGNKDREKENV